MAGNLEKPLTISPGQVQGAPATFLAFWRPYRRSSSGYPPCPGITRAFGQDLSLATVNVLVCRDRLH